MKTTYELVYFSIKGDERGSIIAIKEEYNAPFEMKYFSKDCVLLILASDIYHEGDDIRGYKKFVEKINAYS
jgi:hypothetical protein